MNSEQSEGTEGAIGPKITKKMSDSKSAEKLIIKIEKGPLQDEKESYSPARVAVPRTKLTLSKPVLSAPPLVMLTNLVPSIPVELFEVMAEVIEAATERPTMILYEPRVDRPVDNNITDIAILPMYKNWEGGELLPVTFVFQDRFKLNSNAKIFADIVIADDVTSHAKQDILDLRGCRCAMADRSKSISAASLLFNFLKFHGEGPAFFGNILDTPSQIDALRMVAGRQADVAVLESPIITCNKNLPGVQSLQTLVSLGPLPSYRIMVNKRMPEDLVQKITSYLQEIHEDPDWMETLKPLGVSGFAENSESNYAIENVNSSVTTIPYY